MMIAWAAAFIAATPPSAASDPAVRTAAAPPRATLTPHPLAPPSDDALAQAIHVYRAQELSVGWLSRVQVATTYTFTALDAGQPAVVSDPPAPTRAELAVYRGDTRLDAPTVLGVLGDEAGHQALAERIDRKRQASHNGLVVALSGLIVGSVGLYWMDQASVPEAHEPWRRAAIGGFTAAGVGAVWAALPAARAWRLERDIEVSVAPDELQARIDAHNAALADRLGLSAAEVARIERLHGEGVP